MSATGQADTIRYKPVSVSKKPENCGRRTTKGRPCKNAVRVREKWFFFDRREEEENESFARCMPVAQAKP
ncbi:MAG: hypothetical protein LBL09_01410 [Oscillospiraceae bacterium]|nr:hypothetical protein [Oscillospiraceae bacterium]